MFTALAVAGQCGFIKAEAAMTQTASLTGPSVICAIMGYTSTRGDFGRATIDTVTAGITLLIPGTNNQCYMNFVLDGKSTSTVKGFQGGVNGGVFNIKAVNCPGQGIRFTVTNGYIDYCEVTGCGTSNIGAVDFAAGIVTRSWIHANTVPGINMTTGTVSDSVIEGNTGASSDGIVCNQIGLIQNCVIWNNGRDGIRDVSAGSLLSLGVHNCIIGKNAGFGVNNNSGTVLATSSTYPSVQARNNAFGSGSMANGSGVGSNWDVDSSNITTVSADPFTASGGNDWTLNNSNPGGAQCTNAGIPSSLPGLTGTGYPDVGVYRHQDPAGGGGVIRADGMRGNV